MQFPRIVAILAGAIGLVGVASAAHFGDGPDPRLPFTIENYRGGQIPEELWELGPALGTVICNDEYGSGGLYCLGEARMVLTAHHVGDGACERNNPADFALESERAGEYSKNSPPIIKLANTKLDPQVQSCLKELDVQSFDVLSHDLSSYPCVRLAVDGVSGTDPNTGALVAIHSNIFDVSGELTGDYREHFQEGFDVHTSKNYGNRYIEFPGAATGTMSSGAPVLARSKKDGTFVAVGINTNLFEGDAIRVAISEEESLNDPNSGNIGPSAAAILNCFH